MNWFTGLTKVYNKDTEPNKIWYDICQEINNVYKWNKKEIKKSVVLKEIKYLRPGRTTTIILDSKNFDYLKKIYKNNKKIDDYQYEITLNYKDESKKGNKKNVIFKCIKKTKIDQTLKFICYTNENNIVNFVLNEVISKIERSSFCKGGDRRARWKLDKIHSEYGSFKECHYIAFSLLKSFLYSFISSHELGEKIKNKFVNIENIIKKINKYEYENGYETFIDKNNCPLCLKSYKLKNFLLNARKNKLSLVMGHNRARVDRTENNHNVNNVFWIHRECNFIQGEKTIIKSLEFMKEILKKHNITNYKIL